MMGRKETAKVRSRQKRGFARRGENGGRENGNERKILTEHGHVCKVAEDRGGEAGRE